jgi:bleomycin hydrolase
MKTCRIAIVVACIAAISALSPAKAPAGDRQGLGKTALGEIKGSFPADPANRALMNAVSNNDLKDLSYNREIYNRYNDIFSDNVTAKGITNQKSSGRCWMFAAFNMMRPVVIEKFKLESFEFSENYLFFWDKLEKANTFLGAVIETAGRDIDDRELQALLVSPVPDGGWWNYAVDLIDKYGVVPKEFSQETKHTSSTGRMNAVLDRMARADAAELRKMAAGGADSEALDARRLDMMKEFYRVLVLHMGWPVEEFTWRVKDRDGAIHEKSYTPKSFYEEAVGIDLRDYVAVVDYPAFPYNAYYEVSYCRGMYDRPDMGFINLETAELKKYAMRAIQENEPVWFSADIGKENDGDNGILAPGMYDYENLLGTGHDLTKADFIRYREGSPNHAMVFVGVDVKDGRPVKWRVENSWGTDRGNKGYWTMYDEWFSDYVFNVIVHKKHIPEKIVKLLDTEPVRIPAWDPMRSAFDRR